MPAYPRHEIVASDEVGVYHCIARPSVQSSQSPVSAGVVVSALRHRLNLLAAEPKRRCHSDQNPPLDANDHFVVGPKYVPAAERKKVDGVTQGKVEQFVIGSKEAKLFNPGIARNGFGKAYPNNPKTLVVETHGAFTKRSFPQAGSG
jgi:hypothetical protein